MPKLRTQGFRDRVFHFHGSDEMEEAFGEGQATLEGERLIFEFWLYLGDEWTFECERRR